MIKYLPVKHLLNESQTNLSLPNTTHAIHQEEFLVVMFIITFSCKMFPQFCKNVSLPCELNG